jgi:hypothetical protein
MARNRSSDSPLSPAQAGAAEACDGRRGLESPPLDDESATDLASLLGRMPTNEETARWRTMSAGLRRRAAARIELLRRWTDDRGELTVGDAAKVAGVEPNRFYQMASAWRRQPGLMAVGAYAAGGPDRSSKVDPVVNAALQAEVGRVVKAAGGGSIEAMRRELETAVRNRVSSLGQEGGPRMPSPKTVRAVIAREMARVADMRMLGESVVLDCCPTSLRSSDGTPYDLFCLIDRGTLRILGASIGSIADSVDGYRRAARDALARMRDDTAALPWSVATRRVDIVVGTDAGAWPGMVAELKQAMRPSDVEAITRDKRFGSQFRKYVGERIGGIWLRPTWATKAPPPLADGAEAFSLEEARRRVDTETAAWNATKVIGRDGGVAAPPDGLVEALRLLAG